MWFDKKKNYKFISLKTYAWDRIINNTRRFRKVFDKSEINYLSVALEFYNILFNEKDWKANITFKAYTIDGDKKLNEHCVHQKEYEISKDINAVIIDYGWGNDKKGSYWKKGDYLWEVYIEDELIESTKFHIEDVGLVTNEKNPYFKVESLKTYDILPHDDKDDEYLYLKQFFHNHTTYIHTELNIISHLSEKWLCEVFFNYYDDSGLLIGSTQEIGFINPKRGAGESFKIVGSWGTEDPTVWLKDNYRVEVVFMDTVVGIIPFSVGDELKIRYNDKEALINDRLKALYAVEENQPNLDYDYVANHDEEPPVQINPEDVVLAKPTTTEKTEENVDEGEQKSIEQTLAELKSLIGLSEVKAKINDYIDYVKYLQLRSEQGIDDNKNINLHSVFTGNPGTGKTTVVKLLGTIYKALGLLSKGHVVTVDSNDLVSGYVRQTGEATEKQIEKARGGILFIDEAYMLYKKEGTNDFGNEAIATIITEISDGEGDIAIMLAGYPKEMKDLMSSNPGLKSRFQNHYHFNDFTPNELVEIAQYAAENKKVKLSEAAQKKIKKVITKAFRKRDNSFGNARFVHSLIDEAKMNLGIRLMRNFEDSELNKELLSTIEVQDIKGFEKELFSNNLKLDIDTSLLNEALSELNQLIGLNDVKTEIQQLIRLTKYYNEINRDVLKAFSLHTVFLGNPGTGKTTIARIIGKVYKALGLLERGHVVEADGSSLIAGYVGQTAIKTKELIKNAMGGVLFIDEAYAITEGSGQNNFGKKAVASLLKEMEDHRGEFCVIVAGYPSNMKDFIEANPGVKSRFDKTFYFKDFDEAELWKILLNMLQLKNLTPNSNAEKKLKQYITKLYSTRNKFFGNARSMRKIAEKTIRNQELRMANLTKDQRTKTMIETITVHDVLEFTADKIEYSNRVKIGYHK